jgi:septum formation topological specificity factor MinE
MSEVRNEFVNVLEQIYINIDNDDIDAKIEALKNAMGGKVNVHVYGGNETKEEILGILEYNLISERI